MRKEPEYCEFRYPTIECSFFGAITILFMYLAGWRIDDISPPLVGRNKSVVEITFRRFSS